MSEGIPWTGERNGLAVDGDKLTGEATITNSFLLTGTGEEDKAFANQPIEIL